MGRASRRKIASRNKLNTICQIRLIIRNTEPVICFSWGEVYALIVRSFGGDGLASFSIASNGLIWDEIEICWIMFNAICEGPSQMEMYFHIAGRREIACR